MTAPFACIVTPEKLPGGTPSWVRPNRLYVVPAYCVTPCVLPYCPIFSAIDCAPDPKLAVNANVAGCPAAYPVVVIVPGSVADAATEPMVPSGTGLPLPDPKAT